MNHDRKDFRLIFLCLVFLILSSLAVNGQTAHPEYFTIESYYRVKWGYADEFIKLWKTNHYPLLKKAQEKGDVILIRVESPRFHSGEETRWDLRVTVVFKNVATAFDENLVVPYKKQLFPDPDALGRSEQHRFELLLAHWDVETEEKSL
ncbi:MAG TPA: hypothetical protein VK563_17650 [Puia sp.]|nr:hypothetical protein [Puia sp.]